MTGLVLAQSAGEPSAGPLGLLVIVLLFLATVLLVRNMTKRLKRLPKSFDPPAGRDQEPPATR